MQLWRSWTNLINYKKEKTAPWEGTAKRMDIVLKNEHGMHDLNR